nr:DUF4880 domain-containing protein [uncultured Brevundimonas sp.]
MNGIDEAAAEWAARTDGATLAPGEAAELEAWLAEDPRHAGAYARAQALALAYADAFGGAALPHRSARVVSRRSLLWGGGIAAGVGLAATAGFWFAGADTAYATTRGETRTITFGDGLEARLNTETRVEIGRDGRLPRLRLIDGEIAAKGLGKPYVVQVGDVRLSTEVSHFCLRKTDAGAVLTVESGRLIVIGGTGSGQSVGAAEQAVLSDARIVSIRKLSAEQIGSATAWTSGLIAFEDATLSEAAAEFARYNAVPIVIGDQSAQERRITGLFDARDPAGFARSVAVTSGLSAQVASDRIVLSSASR